MSVWKIVTPVHINVPVVVAALCGEGVCLYLFLLLHIAYLPIFAKLGLVVGMKKQMSDGKEFDILHCYPL